MRKQKHGWILFDKENDEHHGRPFTTEDCRFTSNIEQSKVYATRAAGRVSPTRLHSDTVKKVKLDQLGRAIKIIKGR